jgi:hypothetical protein
MSDKAVLRRERFFQWLPNPTSMSQTQKWLYVLLLFLQYMGGSNCFGHPIHTFLHHTFWRTGHSSHTTTCGDGLECRYKVYE